jgi:hypothetical protein
MPRPRLLAWSGVTSDVQAATSGVTNDVQAATNDAKSDVTERGALDRAVLELQQRSMSNQVGNYESGLI